jgi:hypothetical protein
MTFQPPVQRIGGTVLLIGSAYCVHDDYAAAKAEFPDATEWNVNYSFLEVRGKDQTILTMHFEQTSRMRDMYQRMYDGDNPTIHACLPRDNTRIRDSASVDVWWDFKNCIGSGGGWWAAAISSMIFDDVVLVGMPMEPVKYGDSVASHPFLKTGDWRIGNGVFIYQENAIKTLEAGYMKNVRSMSGFTREILGGPNA